MLIAIRLPPSDLHKTSMNFHPLLDVNFCLLVLFVRMFWRYSDSKNKS